MNYNKIKKFIEEYVIEIIIVILIFVGIGLIIKYNNDKTPYPVEETKLIDSIEKDNVKIIIEINNLDSIKNVKAIEIKSLDNDSTLKLFYQLIGK